MTEPVAFRVAVSDDWPAIWPVFQAVVATGDTYAYQPDISESSARELWLYDGTNRWITFVAELDDAVVGTAYVKPNQPGLGDHIANAGWMIAPGHGGRGIGRAFAEHVIHHARDLGFSGMQFNAVVATNTGAIGLWRSLGFEIVGTVPNAFRHATHGPTAVHVMYRSLT